MSEWNAERIVELRRLAERLREAEKAVSKESGMLASRGGWSAPLDDAISDEDAARHALIINLKGGALLSLLDELESVTRERDTLYASLEANNRTLMEHSARLEALAR